MSERTLIQRLVELAARKIVQRAMPDDVRDRLKKWIEEIVFSLSPVRRRKLLARLTPKLLAHPPPGVMRWLRGALAFRALADKTGDWPLARRWIEYVRQLNDRFRRRIYGTAIRLELGVPKASDEEFWTSIPAEEYLAGQEVEMALTTTFDQRGVPTGFDENAFRSLETGVSDALENLGFPKTGNEVEHATITGMLMLDGVFRTDDFGFADAVLKARLEAAQKAPRINPPGTVFVKEYFQAVKEKIKVPAGSDELVSVQELAFISRFVIERASSVPLGSRTFDTQIGIGREAYVGSVPDVGSLELPPLDGDAGADVEIIPDNIRAAALIYAAHELEEMRLFATVDRITEMFVMGALPVVFDDGGRALDQYFWDREDRMNEAERRMQYSRVLGVPGGDVSRELPPNSQFEQLFLRFLSSVSEYDRERRIAGLFGRGNNNIGVVLGSGSTGSGTGAALGTLTATIERVRQAGRDLAANFTYYGYAYTHFAARRIQQDIDKALRILKEPTIQKAFAASTPYQVIERVWQDVPNIVQRRTSAESGNRILNLIASKPQAWVDASVPLFPDPNLPNVPSAFNAAEEAELIRHTQLWLAVNGIKDEQVDQYSRPVASVYSPSVPVQPGVGGSANGNIERLKKMVSEGQTPSLADLQALLPTIQ